MPDRDGEIVVRVHQAAAAGDDAVAVWHLFSRRPRWPAAAAVGNTLVSSSMIDRVAAHLGRRVMETPVGFKWFVKRADLRLPRVRPARRSAGAALLRRDGTVWVTDKDGIIMDLLAAEITAVHGKDPTMLPLPGARAQAWYARIDAAASKDQRDTLARLSRARSPPLNWPPILAKLGAPRARKQHADRLKVTTDHHWLPARTLGHRGHLQGAHQNPAKEFVSGCGGGPGDRRRGPAGPQQAITIQPVRRPPSRSRVRFFWLSRPSCSFRRRPRSRRRCPARVFCMGLQNG